MKKLLLFSIFLFPISIFSQSLVLNSDFEDSLQCPSGSGAFVNYVANWTKPSYGSADYFYTGCTMNTTDEQPHSGNAYGGIIVYDPANYREYMTGHLSSPLTAGTMYTVAFYVSLNNSCMKAINEIGAYVTSTNIYNTNTLPILVTPQVEGNTPYTDTSGWQLVQGSFTASGGEQYIIIGCFRADSAMTMTNVSNVGWGDIYYYVDDVCLIQGAVPCDNPLNVSTAEKTTGVSVFPNPSDNSATVKFYNPGKEEFTLSVFDARGQLVQTINNITTNEVEIPRENLPDGLYFFQLKSKSKVLTGKLIRD
jgi:hypothetical protein